MFYCKIIVKKHGIKQFVNVFKKFRNNINNEFLWGDEVKI